MKSTCLINSALALALSFWSLPGSAQQPAAAPQPAPAATGTTQLAPPPIECVPDCRVGYMCHQGQCISACNPPCGPGSSCGASGQCVSAQAAVQAPLAQTPPGAGPDYNYNAGATLGTGVMATPPSMVPVPGAPQFREPRALRPKHLRFFFNFDMIPSGAGSYDTVSAGPSGDYDLDPTFGFGGGIELRLGRIFGIAINPRYFATHGDGLGSTGNFDVAIQPTFRIPAGIVEITLPISIGLALQFPEGNLETGTGFLFGFTPGATIWFTRNLGFHANIGYEARVLTWDNDNDLFGNSSDTSGAHLYYNLRVSTGLSFGF